MVALFLSKESVMMMPEFTNLADLGKHIASSYPMFSDQQTEASLIKASARLEEILKEEINNYYKSYTPKVYVRTYDWINSIRVSKPEVTGTTMRIRIYFDDSLAYHKSVMGGNDGYIPMLYEYGFHWSSDKKSRIYRFSDYEGFHPIEKACERYNSTNEFGFVVTITR